MMKLGLGKYLTGLELNESSVKMAQIAKGKRGWKLIRFGSVPFPSEALELSYSKRNIVDYPLFLDTLREAMNLAEGRVTRVGLSLPNEIVKLSIYGFEDLPETEDRILQMIGWKEKETVPFPVGNAKIAYFPLFRLRSTNQKGLLAAIGLKDIIREYETSLRRMKLRPEIVQPAAINHLNFYLPQLDAPGSVGFFGLFEDFFSFFVFEEGRLVFYRGKRKAPSFLRFLHEIDLTIELFLRENPDKTINKLYLGSQIGSMHDLVSEIEDLYNIESSFLDAGENITIEDGIRKRQENPDIASYAAAIGAAQSLAI